MSAINNQISKGITDKKEEKGHEGSEAGTSLVKPENKKQASRA